MTNWSKLHTFGLFLVAGLILGLGGVSTWVTFDATSNWGVWSFFIVAALFVALLGVIGHGLVRRVDGAMMDNRFRISLAQFQLAIWSAVVLGAWGAAVFANLGLNKATDALDVSIPSELWVALGISVTALGGAKLLQVRDAPDPPAPVPPESTGGLMLAQRGEALDDWRRRGKLLAHTTPADANWGDLFAADGADAGGVPDMSKIQMFFFTIVLAFGYAAACVELFATHGSNEITGLPALNESFVILLGISQGGYLAKKGVDSLSP